MVYNVMMEFPQSPDLNPCDFHLSGTLKEKMYVNISRSQEELNKSIRHGIPILHLAFQACV